MAVPKRAQVPRDVPSDAGQQEADADQGRKRDDKPDGGPCECRGRGRIKIRRCDLCLTHDEHLQEIGWFWKTTKGTSNRALWREFICPISMLMSVTGGTHGQPWYG